MEYTEILINIRKMVRSINVESKRIQKEHGLSIPQYLCLNYLSKQEDFRSTAKDIGLHLKLNPSTVTGIISRLELKGYLAKLPNKGDRRSVYIYITALGEKAINAVPGILHEKLETKLKKLDDSELKMLQDSLSRLVEFMEVDDFDAAPMLTTEVKIRPASDSTEE
ncbi:MAG: MarR family winged helix-turn-helix transcriptional regulator [Fluviicola sp.]